MSAGMRDMVTINVTADLPVRATAQPFADRVELRFGKAFPVALVVDGTCLDRLCEAIKDGKQQLVNAGRQV